MCRTTRLVALLSSLLLAVPSTPSAQETPTSILLRGASLIDGTGAPARDADVRIDGDRIVAVGALTPRDGEEVVELAGLVLAPGFIDTHSHADGGIHEHPDAVAVVNQGITTVVVGNDGGSPLPLADFFAGLEADPPAINFAAYSGHGSIRSAVMAEDFERAAGDDEVAAMERLLRADLEAGALGLSTGLEYDPGIYSETSEVIALARVAAEAGGRYISHIRSEDRWFWEAIEEIVAIGRTTGMPVQVGHMKLAMKDWWGQADRLLARLDEARAAGVDITADVYPYPYWQSTLTVLFPDRDFDDLDEARRVLAQIVPPEGVLVTTYAPNPEYAGRTLDAIAEMRGEEPAVALLALIHDALELEASLSEQERGSVDVESMIGTSMAEEDIEALLAWEHTNFCTDGGLAGSHPRGYGSFPRILGRYVRERGIMSLEEAVHKASGLAAEHMGFTDRGRVAEGMIADLVAFDPETVLDHATTEEPQALSVGVAGVWVAGQRVWDGEAPTGARPGRVIRRQDSATYSGGR